ncbi:MAG: hypothetical protein QXG11_05660, partial [Candidatus Bathyarchaeia archaeon]
PLCSGTGWRNEQCDEHGIKALLSLNEDEFYSHVREMVRITADELPVISTVWWTMTMFAYRTDKLINWNWEVCTKTPIWGHPLVIRPMTTHLLTPVTWVPTPPPATPTPAPTGPTPTPTPTGPTPAPTPKPTPTPTGPTPTPAATPTPTPTAAPTGMPTEQIISIAVVVIVIIAIIGYIAIRIRKKTK